MWTFIADARNGTNGGSCDVCCCQSLVAKPGETNKMLIDYSAWVLPMRGKGLSMRTHIDIAVLSASETPPVQVSMSTPVNTPASVNVPVDSTAIPMYAPQHGTFDYDTRTYTPNAGFTGTDRFFFRDPDGNVGEAAIGVGETAPDFLNPVDTPGARMNVNVRHNQLSFPVVVSPTARDGELYRMTVNQPALDCDGQEYIHISCYDVRIGKCGF